MKGLKLNMSAVLLALTTMLSGCFGNAAAIAPLTAETAAAAQNGAVTESSAKNDYFKKGSLISDVANHPAFEDYGRLIFPANPGYYSGNTLGELSLTWYSNIDADETVEIANYMKNHAEAGDAIFYDIYTDGEKAADPAKEDTGLFYFRGEPGAPFAIINAGGGFAYVGAMHDSFPHALELSKTGYNAFALIYRPGARTACEDLAAAISFIFKNADALQVSTDDYSLWGGSAGARMAANLGSYGAVAYGGDDLPKPAAVIMQYTGHSDYTETDPPTYVCVGENDSIASWRTMERRVKNLREAGIDTEFHIYPNLGHGFGLGTGTSAEGWFDDAIAFWEKQMSDATAKPGSLTHPIPQELAAIPQEYYSPAEQQGTLADLNYDTYESMKYEKKTQAFRKRAVVYLPYGYSEDERYNVFYLMHGGWGNETTTLGTPENPGFFKNVIDNAISAGEIEPLIIVCPTYNNTSPEDSASFSLALELNRNYHNELKNDLIPAVESKYSTYAESVAPEDLMASRNHRGFGGFSMGSVATWRTFQNGLDYFRYFLPMSCGTGLTDENIYAAASKRSDFFVWVITGTEDFAYSYDNNRVELMRNSPHFTESDNERDGNFAYSVKDGYDHGGVAALEYTYNGLRWFWSAS